MICVKIFSGWLSDQYFRRPHLVHHSQWFFGSLSNVCHYGWPSAIVPLRLNWTCILLHTLINGRVLWYNIADILTDLLGFLLLTDAPLSALHVWFMIPWMILTLASPLLCLQCILRFFIR